MSRRHILMAGGLGLLAITGSAHANSLYFAMPLNYTGGETDSIFVYGAPGITGSVTSPNGFSSLFSIGASKVATIGVPNSFDLTTSGLVTNNGFVISTTNASDKVGASYLSRQTATTDTTYLYDSTALGTKYYAAGYQNNIGFPSQLTIVGTQAATQVTITPSGSGFTSGQPGGAPFSVNLGAGQAVLYTGNDVTGSFISSTAPIAVFGGNGCANVPTGVGACDHLITALPSTDQYTKSAVIATTVGTEGTSSNIVRVVAATNGTTVTYNGSTVATLNAGDFTDFRSGAGGLLTADNPVLVTELLTGQNEHPATVGDPAMSWIPGTDQWLKDYIFSTPVGTEAYVTNFLDVVIPTSSVGSLVLNGSSVPGSDCSVLGSTGYSVCNISIAPGSGEILALDPFLLLLNGGTTFDSYFTFAGATFSPGASPPPPPVSEPGTLALMMAGLAGLTIAGYRRKQARG